jgi:glucose/mannose-6-phosphate isomerase
MRDDVLALGEHLRDALWKAESAGIARRDSSGLVVAGMGGSGIGARLAAAAIGSRARRPIVVAAGYDLPPWVDSSWTVLCSSYSGATEETLSAYAVAGERGAHRIAVTSGGELADRARQDGVPVIPVAGGFQPRAAVGYALVSALEVAALCGAAPSLRDEIEAAAAAVGDDDRAAALADAIGDRVPVIYGAELTAPVAYRWKTQVNENVNAHAFASELPEADHNEIEGWQAGDDTFAAVFLDDADTHPRTRRRIGLTREIIGTGAVIEGRGATRTERLVDLVVLGDLVSLTLAGRRGADAYAIPALHRLKAELAAS